jgi:hypothetical protein
MAVTVLPPLRSIFLSLTLLDQTADRQIRSTGFSISYLELLIGVFFLSKLICPTTNFWP